MKKNIFFILIMLYAFSVSATTYRSVGSGSVNTQANWVDSVGLAPLNFTGTGNTFIIQNSHSMTTVNRWSIGGAANNAANKSVLEIQNGGVLTATFLVDVAVFQLDEGSSYVHNTYSTSATNNSGDIPGYGTVANGIPLGRNFATTSTIEIQKWSILGAVTLYNGTESLPKIPYGNLTINIATLSTNWRIGMNPFIVKGNLDIKATGGGAYSFKAGYNDSILIGGDFIMEGGKFSLTDEPGGAPAIKFFMSVGGNFTQNGGSFTLADVGVPYTLSGTFLGGTNHVLNVAGNTTLSGGYFCGSGYITTGGVYTDATKITNVTTATGPYNTYPTTTPQVGWGISGLGIPSNLVGDTITNITGSTYTMSSKSIMSEIGNANLFAGPIVSCVIANGNVNVRVPNASSLFQIGMRVGGNNIAFGTKVTGIIAPDTIKLSLAGLSGSNSTIIPEYVTLTGTTAGYNNANYNLNLVGDLTIGAGATFAWTNIAMDSATATSSIVLGGSLTIDPAATVVSPPAWSTSSTNVAGGASVYFKNGRSNVDLNIPSGMANKNIGWVIASGKTVRLINDLTVNKFFSVAGVLDSNSYLKKIYFAAQSTTSGITDLTTSSVSTFHGTLFMNNESRIQFIPKSPVSPQVAPVFLLGMEVVCSVPAYLAPNTIITQILTVGTNYMIGLSPASTTAAGNAPQVSYNSATITFNAGTTASMLPLKLLSFKAMLVNTGVQLNWATSNEVGVKEFIIEKSSNGIDFNAIGTTSAKYVTSTNTYTFTDVEGFAYKTNYYRLKMMDLDGDFSYSNIEIISVPVLYKVDIVRAYPNPTHGMVTISHPDAVNGAFISIVSLSGTVLSTINVTEHALQTNFNASNLPAGNYIIVFYNNGKALKSQFIKI